MTTSTSTPTIGSIITRCARADATRANISQDLLTLTREYRGVDAFLTACAEAEEKVKGRGQDVPRTWTQLKSNVKSAWKLGLNPYDYESETALRKAAKDARNAQKKASDEAGETVNGKTSEQINAQLANAISDYIDQLAKEGVSKAAALGQIAKFIGSMS